MGRKALELCKRTACCNARYSSNLCKCVRVYGFVWFVRPDSVSITLHKRSVWLHLSGCVKCIGNAICSSHISLILEGEICICQLLGAFTPVSRLCGYKLAVTCYVREQGCSLVIYVLQASSMLLHTADTCARKVRECGRVKHDCICKISKHILHMLHAASSILLGFIFHLSRAACDLLNWTNAERHRGIVAVIAVLVGFCATRSVHALVCCGYFLRRLCFRVQLLFAAAAAKRGSYGYRNIDIINVSLAAHYANETHLLQVMLYLLI